MNDDKLQSIIVNVVEAPKPQPIRVTVDVAPASEAPYRPRGGEVSDHARNRTFLPTAVFDHPLACVVVSKRFGRANVDRLVEPDVFTTLEIFHVAQFVEEDALEHSVKLKWISIAVNLKNDKGARRLVGVAANKNHLATFSRCLTRRTRNFHSISKQVNDRILCEAMLLQKLLMAQSTVWIHRDDANDRFVTFRLLFFDEANVQPRSHLVKGILQTLFLASKFPCLAL